MHITDIGAYIREYLLLVHFPAPAWPSLSKTCMSIPTTSAKSVKIMVSVICKLCFIVMLKGVPYDCSSIMHYGTETFSVGGEELPTMKRRHPDCDLRSVDCHHEEDCDVMMLQMIVMIRMTIL